MFDTTVGVVQAAAQVRDAAASLASVARSSGAWSAPDRAVVLEAVQVSEAALAEARAHLLVADRAAGDSVRPGDRSFAAARARVTRSGLGEAVRQVRQADALVSMGTVAEAVRQGVMPVGHLDELARVAAGASPEVAAVLRTPVAQEVVVGMARAANRPDFGRSLAGWVASLDPAALEDAHGRQYRERFFAVAVRSEGVFLKGRLDRVAGESLRVALDAMGQHGDETRSPGQAAADALTMLAERACAGAAVGSATSAGQDTPTGTATAAGVTGREVPAGTAATAVAGTPSGTATTGTGSGSVSRPHVSLLVPAETVAELLTHQRALDAAAREAAARDTAVRGDGPAGGGTGTAAGERVCAPISLPWGSVAPATLEDGTPVAMSELARVLCEADVTRIVMSAESLPLDVGRAKRLFTTAQRRAAVVRDRGCVWNGCEQPPARCEVHHIRWWDRHHGPTSLTNAALLCRYHHTQVHQHHLDLQRLEKPPGSTRRTRARAGMPHATGPVETADTAEATSAAATTGAAAGTDAPDGLFAAPTGTPLRYVFRNPRGQIINAPTEAVPDRRDDDSAATGKRRAREWLTSGEQGPDWADDGLAPGA